MVFSILPIPPYFLDENEFVLKKTQFVFNPIKRNKNGTEILKTNLVHSRTLISTPR
jgi:hypothetical protein